MLIMVIPKVGLVDSRNLHKLLEIKQSIDVFIVLLIYFWLIFI